MIASAQPVFRFAPSPNGSLHLGHALSALTNQRIAAMVSGRLLLRVEDIDTARCTPALEAAMLHDLDWLGIEWEQPVRRQSQHFATYREALDRLIRDELVYPAFMSRAEARAAIARSDRPWPHDPDGVPFYPPQDKALGRPEWQRRIADGASFAWRLDMAAALERTGAALSWREFDDPDMASTREVEVDPAAWGDVVLARRDTPASYHLCVAIDDALQGVSHVVRGMDLYAATSVQRVLQRLLGLPRPVYHHHRLVLGPDGRKLSKSAGSESLAQLRAAGRTPADLRRMLGLV